MARMSAGEVRGLVAELENLKGRFDAAGATCRRKLELLAALRDARLRRPADLRSYHDSLLFLRAYPDSAEVLEAAERELAGFGERVAAYTKASDDIGASALPDSGIVGTTASNVFTYRFVGTMARLHPGRLDVDWDAYNESESSNALTAIVPAISWHENDAIDNDPRFEPRTWLRLSTPSGGNSLDALLRLLATSRLPWELQRTLYDAAGLPVAWRLADYEASRTGRRVPGAPTHFMDGPPLKRTADLRADLAHPAAPLTPVSRTRGREYVRAIVEVLGARVRELYPLTGASPDEVALFEPGRGVRIVVYGSLPEIRLPLEANFGVMLVRSGVPIGYGIGAMLFDRCEIAINVFPEYRSGESAFVIEKLIHLFAAHFGARVMLIRPYQIGMDNEEALESGSFWFYYKLGFRPVRERIRALAEEEAARIAADRSYRSPRATLKKLATSDMFFHVDASQMDGYRELKVAHVGYAVTRFIACEFGGDRWRAERDSVRRVAAWLGLSAWRRWTPDEVRAFQRMAPMLAAMPGVERWSRRDKALLARVMRAKGSVRERRYALLAGRHGTFRKAVERLADEAGTPRPRSGGGP